jgi:hypothetical protein
VAVGTRYGRMMNCNKSPLIREEGFKTATTDAAVMVTGAAAATNDPYSNLFVDSGNAHRFSVSSLLQLEVKCKKGGAKNNMGKQNARKPTHITFIISYSNNSCRANYVGHQKLVQITPSCSSLV